MWAQVKMAQSINIPLTSIPSESRDSFEFIFYCEISLTTESLVMIWDPILFEIIGISLLHHCMAYIECSKP